MSGGDGAGECPSIIHLKRDCCPPVSFIPPIMGPSSSPDRLPPGASPDKRKNKHLWAHYILLMFSSIQPSPELNKFVFSMTGIKVLKARGRWMTVVIATTITKVMCLCLHKLDRYNWMVLVGSPRQTDRPVTGYFHHI